MIQLIAQAAGHFEQFFIVEIANIFFPNGGDFAHGLAVMLDKFIHIFNGFIVGHAEGF